MLRVRLRREERRERAAQRDVAEHLGRVIEAVALAPLDVREHPIEPERIEETLDQLRALIASADETDLAGRVVGVVSSGLAPGDESPALSQ